MFDLLKKKISGFVGKLGGKKEEPEAPPAKEKKELILEKEAAPAEAPIKEEKKTPPARKAKEPVPEKKEKEKKPEVKEEVKAPGLAKEKKEEAIPKESGRGKEEPDAKEEAVPEPVKKEIPTPFPKPEKKEEKKEAPKPEKKETVAPKLEEREEKPEKKEPPKPAEKKKGLLEKLLGPKKKKEPTEEIPPKKEEQEELVEEEGEAFIPEDPEGEEVPGEGPAEEVPGGEPPEEPEKKKPAPKEEVAKKREEELRKKVKKGLFAAVAETVTGESEVKESEVVELLEELELGMLESDVALSVAEEIKEELRKKILGAKVKRGQTAVFVKESLREILVGMFRETPGFEIHEKFAGKEKPYKIMVVGPNGAGKTTTIAKIVTLLQKGGNSVCVAASDTFRAAAVEQLVHHGNKLGIKVVHGAYGSDPTSIAFDAVNYAKANGLDVVIIDTAGRQETNINLINQLKKMDRVIAPDLKIYVGESIAGNAMVEQISRFNADVGLDGVILTKLDCDAKGGTVISVSGVAKLPILYVGVGQGYGDLKKFVAEEIVEEILS